MRTSWVVSAVAASAMVVFTGSAALAGAHPAAGGTDSVGGAWRTAHEVRGLAALNAGGDAQVLSVSCASPGNCGAGGYYEDTRAFHEAFVVSEVNGTWGRATEIPGVATLNTGADAWVTSVSCASARNCTAGGFYAVASVGGDLLQAFVASEVNGIWHSAIEVPGTGALNADGLAKVTSVSCASPGNCTAVGTYLDNSVHLQVFGVSETAGSWHHAVELPGIGVLNSGGFAGPATVSCAGPGNCSAGGSYKDGSGSRQAFVAGEVDGTWGRAAEVPGSAAANAGGQAAITTVSCPSAGNCSAGGYYSDRFINNQALVASEVHRTWRTASALPFPAGIGLVYSLISSLSCASPGNCSAGGLYGDTSGNEHAFVASEVGGTWQAAVEVPGTAGLNAGGDAQVNSVSCAPAGNCSAGGFYSDSSGHKQAFVASEVGGTWQAAVEVPGTAGLNAGGDAQVNSVSCAPAGNCSAGGLYSDMSGHGQGFIANRT
ncbi:MAG TPA: hypothetical protein VGS19_31370 [Streptosporangiaceae bacterium]|nr:hypothetical protein [Streptosporangiaceae bacterium]